MLKVISVVSIALLSVFGLTACSSAEPEAVDTGTDVAIGTDLPSSAVIGSSVAEVSLPDVTSGGEPFAMVAEPGGALVAYFGFTYCPDVCPTTLSDLKSALESMGTAADSVEVAMVTVDPNRDTDEVISAYLQTFVPDGHALRTDDAVLLKEAGDAFGADFSVITPAEGGVEVTHTAYLYAVDDQGVIRVVWPFGAEPDRIATDLEALLSEG
jgi:protein SCO1/2